METQKSKSDQYRALDQNARSRYDEKMKLCGGLDPYDLNDCLWKMGQASLSLTPDIDIESLFCYLVLERDGITKEAFKAYKALESYRMVAEGFVGSFGIFTANNTTLLVKAKVLKLFLGAKYKHTYNQTVFSLQVSHSQSLNLPPTNPWVACKTDGYVICAHCDCAAG